MMKKLITVTLLLLTIIPCLRAQRKEISQARSYIKSGKDFAKAEQLLRGVMANDSASGRDPRVHALLLQSIEKQYAEGNEKLYLRQKYDTTTFFVLTKKLFDVSWQLDSLDAIPDKKGRVKAKYRGRNAQMLNKCRPNLFYGGTYHLRKGNYRDAFELFDMYIQCMSHPMFGTFDYAKTDKRLSEAAYWACYSATNLNNPDLVLKHDSLAEGDSTKLDYLLMYVAEAHLQKGDTSAYHTTLKRGFSQYPRFRYFFPHLMDYYTENGDYGSCLSLANEALSVDSTNILFLYAKANTLLSLGRIDECVEVSKRIIELNDTVAEAYYYIGMAILNKIVAYEKADERQDKTQIKALYKEAMPYLENYRVLAPEEKKKWAPALYRVYLNLNMGKQFDDIDRIINEEKP